MAAEWHALTHRHLKNLLTVFHLGSQQKGGKGLIFFVFLMKLSIDFSTRLEYINISGSRIKSIESTLPKGG